MIFQTAFDYNSSKTENIQNTFRVNHIGYDIDKFRLETYGRHIELYGKKEELEYFKNKYDTDHLVLFETYKQEWHLAFNGLLAE